MSLFEAASDKSYSCFSDKEFINGYLIPFNMNKKYDETTPPISKHFVFISILVVSVVILLSVQHQLKRKSP